jgi:acyl-CoA synthetase (AMP-forming)/AMP-acid ligase II
MDNFAGILDYHADRRPEKVILAHGETMYTTIELLERVEAAAAALLDMGVGVGDRIALLLYNRPEFVELIFAANRIGAAALPLNYRLAKPEWAYILGHSGAAVLITEPEFLSGCEEICDDLRDLRHLVMVTGGDADDAPRDASSQWVQYTSLIKDHRGQHVPVTDVGPDALQRLMYTSGTTSRPKGVRISHRNLMYKNLGLLVQFGWHSDEITAVCGPLYHVGALDMGGLATLHAGGSLVLQTRFHASNLLDLIQQHRVTSVWLAPSMVNAVLQAENLHTADLSSLRLILSGGEKMPESRLRQILEIFPDLWFADAYGLTETVSSDTFLPQKHMYDKIGSVGRPLPHVQVRILDPEGTETPRGTIGEIAIRGPKVFTGYWCDEPATKEALRGGWFHTGDMGRQDDDGFFYVEDRKKDMIVSGGENIATPEVERILYDHPDVLEASVVGRPDERWGQVPHAYVVLRAGATRDADQLIEFCRERLAKFKAPRSIEFIDELPRTPSGKVLKRVLRESIGKTRS